MLWGLCPCSIWCFPTVSQLRKLPANRPLVLIWLRWEQFDFTFTLVLFCFYYVWPCDAGQIKGSGRRMANIYLRGFSAGWDLWCQVPDKSSCIISHILLSADSAHSVCKTAGVHTSYLVHCLHLWHCREAKMVEQATSPSWQKPNWTLQIIYFYILCWTSYINNGNFVQNKTARCCINKIYQL